MHSIPQLSSKYLFEMHSGSERFALRFALCPVHRTVSAVSFTLLVVAQGVAVTVSEQSQDTAALDEKVETVAHIKVTAHDVAVLLQVKFFRTYL